MIRHSLLASLLAGVAILFSASAAQAETATIEPEVVTEPSAAEVAAAPAPEAPVAQPSQSPDDVSGGNEYTEDGVPTGTGEDSQPVEPAPEAPPSNPTQGTGDSSAGESVSVQGTADETATEATTAATLPRTGAETTLLALIGLGLLALGAALGRIAGAAAKG